MLTIMIKKRVVLFLFIILALQLVSAAVKIEKTAIISDVVPEINQSAIFNFKITNLGESDTFQIYSLVGVSMFPNETFSINSGETKELEVKVYPEATILRNPGTFNFIYKINGEKSGLQQEDVMLIRIVKLKDALEINSYNIELDSDEATVYVRNLVSLPFPEIKADFHSAFFDFSKTFSLEAYEKKEFDVSLNKDKIKELLAGSYIISSNIETYNAKEQIEDSFRYAEKEFIKTQESGSNFLIYSKIVVEKINQGNLPSMAQVRINKNIISRLFTTFNIEPARVERKGFAINYVFQKEIKPAETFTVKAVTNWLYPLILLAAIIIIALLVKTYTSTYLILKKRASFVKTKGGEFALKVSIDVRARKFAEKIHVVDRVPALVKIHERFGILVPSKIDEKNRRLEWDIDSLQPGEERVFSYIVYSKIAPIGKFELPLATAIYERDGTIHEAESNRVFFLTEPRKSSETYW